MNVGFNAVLIFGRFGVPALGLTGAGIGTALAMGLQFALHLAHFLVFALHARDARGRSALIRRNGRAQMRASFAMGAQYFAEGGSYALATSFIAWLGAVALASSRSSTASRRTVLLHGAACHAGAVGVRMAQAGGAGRLAAIGESRCRALPCGLLHGVRNRAFSPARPARFATAFTNDAAVIALSRNDVRGGGGGAFDDGIQSVSLGALRGLNDHRYPTIVTLVAYWLIALPAAYLLALPYKPWRCRCLARLRARVSPLPPFSSRSGCSG